MANLNSSPSLIRNLDQSGDKKDSVDSKFLLTVIIVALILGTVIGFVLNKLQPQQANNNASSQNQPKNSAGIADKKTFKDKATGVLQEGGIDGEGSFHLERPGGESQNVYLTSSTVDLSAYIGKKVRVWGETFQAQKAGWLMDVGLVESL